MKLELKKIKLDPLPSAQRAIVKDLYIPKILRGKIKVSKDLDRKDGNQVVD